MGAPFPGSIPRTGLCQGESGSGASLGASIACLTERFAAFSDGLVFRGDCCVLSKSDFCDEQDHPSDGKSEDGFCAWWMMR